MNKKAIWIIIVLMALALLGSILLQAYWINWSIDLEEKRFDQSVFETLNRVAEKLQTLEDMQQEAALFMPELKGSGFSRQLIGKVDSTSGLDRFQETDSISLQRIEEIQSRIGQPEMRRLGLQKVAQSITPPPLVERIELNRLDEFLQQQLLSHGIRAGYTYGIFSLRKNTFVIRDGHYLFEEEGDRRASDLISNNYLQNSPYSVHLFPADYESPGTLMIYFPSRTRVVWKSGWKTLLASIIFTSIILFCFAYTVQVIFQQKKLSEMKNDFVNNMTHEFKTPIATISLAADSISSSRVANDPEKLQRFADIIRQENKRMHGQVERVLQMAQIDRGKMQLKVGVVNMHQVIQQAIQNLTLQVESRGGEIRTELKAERPQVHGDSTHLSNIIHNLLDNANKYSPDAPQITIRTRDLSKGLEIQVSDRGIGMSKEARKHIFDKFYRVHTGNLHDVKGFGLGLSYVKAVVKAHQGEVSVKSEPGKGSTFILLLPVKHQQ